MRGPRHVRLPVVAVLSADLVSTLGTEMTAVALPWFVLVTTGSPARMAGVMAAEFAGISLLGLPGGRLAQALGPRRALLAADAVRAPLLLLVPVLHWVGALHYAVLLVVGLAVGACFPGYTSSQRLVVASAVGDDAVAVTRLGGVLGAVNETASFLGPALGGVLIVLVGAPAVLVVDAGSYLTSFLLVAVLVPATATAAGARDRAGRARMTDGVRRLWRDVALRRQVLAVMVAEVGWTALMATLPVAARHRYGGGAALAGAFVAAYGAGSVVGGLAVARTKRLSRHRVGGSLVVLAAAAWLLVPRVPAWVVATVVVVVGVCNGVYFPRLFAALTLRPQIEARGPVMTAAQTAMATTAPVGFVAAGLLLDHGAMAAAFLLVAGAATVAAVVSVTGEPLRAGVDVERLAAQEADQGEPHLVGKLDRE